MDEPVDPYGAGWLPSTPPHPYPLVQGYPAPAAYPYPAQPVTPSGFTAGRPKRQLKRRQALLVGGAVVVALGLLVTALSTDSKPKSLSPLVVPTTIGNFTQITDATADRVRSSLEQESDSYGIAKAFFDHTSLGVYGLSGDNEPSLILIVGHTESIPGIQSDNADDSVRLLLEGAVVTATPYSSGRHGGSLQCGSSEQSASLETVCGWYDKSTVGLLLSVRPPRPPAALAQLAQTVRDDLEP